MKANKLIKSFVAGMAFPATFLPLAYTIIFLLEPDTILNTPLQFIAMYIPILFGIANIITVKTKVTKNPHLWAVGACLGLIIACVGVFRLYLPERVLGATNGFEYLPLIALPIIYGAIFRYIVKWLNKELQHH